MARRVTLPKKRPTTDSYVEDSHNPAVVRDFNSTAFSSSQGVLDSSRNPLARYQPPSGISTTQPLAPGPQTLATVKEGPVQLLQRYAQAQAHSSQPASIAPLQRQMAAISATAELGILSAAMARPIQTADVWPRPDQLLAQVTQPTSHALFQGVEAMAQQTSVLAGQHLVPVMPIAWPTPALSYAQGALPSSMLLTPFFLGSGWAADPVSLWAAAGSYKP